MELDVHLVPFRGGFKIIEGNQYEGPCDDHQKISCAQFEDDVGMNSGLYDPVLDDTDVIYEPTDIDQEPDFDQPSRPTEVDLDNLDTLLLNGLPEFIDAKQRELLSESRSVTASPFLCPTKPYRPFSTEPVAQIPELEEPIVLNPEYHDDFDKVLLNIDEDFLPKTRFKLPVSEQYDPDGTKKIGSKIEDVTKKENVTKIEDVTEMREVRENWERSDVSEIKKVSISDNKESFEQKIASSIEEIEKTASHIVEESIGKAVVVAEEIKQEIDVALHETSTVTSATTGTESKVDLQRKQIITDSKVADTKSHSIVNLDIKSENTLSNDNKIGVKLAKEIFENVDKQQTCGEPKSSARQEVKETIQSGTVKSKTAVYDKAKDEKVTKESIKNDTHHKSVEQKKAHSAQSNKNVKENVTRTKTTSSTKTTGKSKTNEKTKSQQNAYFIGLQTIPNIRGTIHSNYHFDMLLKTFLVHLTDVMVALSRFIVTDPGQLKFFDNIGKCQMGKKEEQEHEVEEEDNEEEVEQQEEELREEVVAETRTQEEILETQEQEQKEDVQILRQSFEDQQVKCLATDMVSTVAETHEKRHLSGSEMAYSEMTEKSEDLITKLGAVINEFETKTGIETMEGNFNLDERSRSRSRSKTKEIIKKVEPAVLATTIVDAANKIISKCHETSQITKSSNVSSTQSQDMTKYETNRSSAVEESKTYVAIVEAHVYTNKDLLEQQVSDLYTESSVSKSAEEKNVALICNEAVSMEKVALKDLVNEKEEIKPDLIETPKLPESEFVHQTENNQEEAFLGQTSLKVKTATKIDEEKVFLDKTSSKNDSEMTELHAVQGKLVKPMQKARIVKGILKQAKNEIKSDALKEINQFAENKSTVVEQEVSQSFDKTSETRVVEEKSCQVTALVEESKTEIKDETKVNLTDIDLSVSLDNIQSDIKTEESAALKITKEKATELQQVTMQLEELRDIQKKNEISQEESKSVQSYGSHKVEIQKVESQEVESQIIESQKVESQKVESQKVESQKVESQKVENQKVESQKVEEIKKLEESFTFSSETVDQECSFMAKSVDQESSFVIKTFDTAKVEEKSTRINEKSVQIDEKSVQINEKSVQIDKHLTTAIETQQEVNEIKKLTLKTDIPLKKSDSDTSATSDISTPTPATIPPTPLTNEYMFRLQCPLPPEPEIPVPRDCTPSDSEDEDPHIVKKGLIPHIDTQIEEIIVYDTPLKTPPGSPGSPKTPGSPGSPKATPVYTKPGLKGGGNRREQKNEEILEIERKSTLLTSAIDQTIKSIEEYKEDVGIKQNDKKPAKTMAFEAEIHIENCPYPNVINGVENTNGGNVLEGYRPVQFNPEELQSARRELKSAMVSNGQVLQNQKVRQLFRAESGEIIGTHQGIVDGLDKAIVDNTTEELGKPGMTEEKIAELISGESEMLREAHVMGLCRVLSTKMHRPSDGSSVDFKKLKPVIESLNHSEVLKALNEEMMRTKEEKKKEERKWTTFMQKPQRPVPRVKFGYHGYSEQVSREQEPYKPKIVKQPKPKIAPDYKPEVFETGLLPWEERALREPTPPPVAPEDPILIPEEEPEILEAVDPLPESEVPDLEDSGIPLPTSKTEEDQTEEDEEGTVEIEELDIEAVVEEAEKIVEENIDTLVEEMETGNVTEQIMANVQNMVDPSAPLEQQLCGMRAQLAALAQLPGAIQHSLEVVAQQLAQLVALESQIKNKTAENTSEATKDDSEETQTKDAEEQLEEQKDEGVVITEEPQPSALEDNQPTAEDLERMRREEEAMLEEQKRMEKQKKIETWNDIWPWGDDKQYSNQHRINFMKYEKPPVTLDHLQESETYKLIHNMESQPPKRVETLTPQLCEADYSQICRSITPCTDRMAKEEHLDYPQQVQP